MERRPTPAKATAAPCAEEAVLIPVKSLDRAKLRLSQNLLPTDRRRLGLAMLADVLRATEKWPVKLVVTSDPDAEAVGLAFGCRLVADPGGGLNNALAAGTRTAVDLGINTLLILPADVPMVGPDDVASLFSSPHNVVIASSSDGGTNALLRRPPDCLPTAFGPGSARAHRRAAQERGLSCALIELDSLNLDIDRFTDLEHLSKLPNARDSVQLAADLVERYRS
ncbi:MAG: 2-phospho-L-lactate guanylyltransferase [Actinomycetota bacterium]